MPENTLILLRHAETAINKKIPSSEWKLSLKGNEQALSLLTDSYLSDVQIIVTSSEKKALRTIEPLAEQLSISIQEFDEFNELCRDRGQFGTKEEYNENVKYCFGEPNIAINNWETANEALERFSRKIAEIDNKYRNKKIIIVSHGLILNLYFAQTLGEQKHLYKRWLQTEFCQYGIIEKSAVVKDIASLQQEIYEFK